MTDAMTDETLTGSARNSENPLTEEELAGINAYWRAANYLSVGQIYLLDNPLLHERWRRSTSSPAYSGTGAPLPA